mmetsp:Transcript_30168/g.50755  ORF Transcript_30168/g.50755 Transcript_30168/m.50755 type:complete len:196 (-) Transcript_30168:570-1157(-)
MFTRFRRIHRKSKKDVYLHGEDMEHEHLSVKVLAHIAPKLTMKHVYFAEEKIASTQITRDKMSTDDVLTLLQFSGLNPTVPSIELALRECRLNEAEFVDFRGFLKLWSRYISDVDEELMLSKAFAFFDKDDSGSISSAEFMVTMTELGEKISTKEINLFVSLIDKNGDNEIQFDELVSALRQDNVDFAKMGEDNE